MYDWINWINSETDADPEYDGNFLVMTTFEDSDSKNDMNLKILEFSAEKEKFLNVDTRHNERVIYWADFNYPWEHK